MTCCQQRAFFLPRTALKPLNWIWGKLIESKISMSSTKFVFFGPIRKPRCGNKCGTLYSGARYVALWASCWLLLWNRWTEFNQTLQKARSQPPLPSLCFSGRQEKQDGRPGLWLAETFWLLLWNRWAEFNETWQEARSQRPLQSLCFFGWSEKQDGRPGLWLAETFSTSPLKLLNGIQRNLTGSKISTSSTMFVFFGPIGKTRWPPWPLIGWDIFDFSSETAELNSTKLHRMQDLNVLYQVCVFRADRKNKMAALASDWLTHFRLLLWNRWTEFNET